MNFTADLVADALYQIEAIKQKMCRVYSATREDIFNVSIQELPEWSIIYKMLFDRKELDSYTMTHTSFVTSAIDSMSKNTILLAAKYQVENYFSQSEFHKDDHLKKL